MKCLWPMIQAFHRAVASWQARGAVRSSYKDALSAALDWKNPVSAVFAGREGLQSVTALNVISAAVVRKLAWAGPDHHTTSTKSVRKIGLPCLKEAARPLSISFQGIMK
jgi:hypothetical protein